MKIRRTLLSGWLLICLLLAGQLSLLVHETDHFNQTVAGPCVVCLNNSVFTDASPAPALVLSQNFTTKLIVDIHSAPVLNRDLLTATEPRAPPRHS